MEQEISRQILIDLLLDVELKTEEIEQGSSRPIMIDFQLEF